MRYLWLIYITCHGARGSPPSQIRCGIIDLPPESTGATALPMTLSAQICHSFGLQKGSIALPSRFQSPLGY
jgi:hypothetical protein